MSTLSVNKVKIKHKNIMEIPSPPIPEVTSHHCIRTNHTQHHKPMTTCGPRDYFIYRKRTSLRNVHSGLSVVKVKWLYVQHRRQFGWVIITFHPYRDGCSNGLKLLHIQMNFETVRKIIT